MNVDGPLVWRVLAEGCPIGALPPSGLTDRGTGGGNVKFPGLLVRIWRTGRRENDGPSLRAGGRRHLSESAATIGDPVVGVFKGDGHCTHFAIVVKWSSLSVVTWRPACGISLRVQHHHRCTDDSSGDQVPATVRGGHERIVSAGHCEADHPEDGAGDPDQAGERDDDEHGGFLLTIMFAMVHHAVCGE